VPETFESEWPAILTIEEVSRYLRITRSTVYRLARKGGLPGWKLGHVWRFTLASIDRHIAEAQRTRQREARHHPRGRLHA
jgi:excisionase family DNA binding protein